MEKHKIELLRTDNWVQGYEWVTCPTCLTDESMLDYIVEFMKLHPNKKVYRHSSYQEFEPNGKIDERTKQPLGFKVEGMILYIQ